MNTRDIRAYLRDRLKTLPSRPGTAWPNVSLDPGEIPRFEVQFSGINREDPSLKGGQILYETGTFNVIVCVAKALGENPALDYADSIVELYPKGHRGSFTGGEMAITAAPQIKSGYPDDTSYRIPVAVTYRANKT